MSREAFESFMRRQHENISLDRIGTGEYREWFVWRTWQAWRVATNAALEEAAGYELDAKRYRWLRSGEHGIEFRDGDGVWRADCPRAEELDALIDAALKEQGCK